MNACVAQTGLMGPPPGVPNSVRGETEHTGRDHWSYHSSGPEVLTSEWSNLTLALAVSLHLEGDTFVRRREGR